MISPFPGFEWKLETLFTLGYLSKESALLLPVSAHQSDVVKREVSFRCPLFATTGVSKRECK